MRMATVLQGKHQPCAIISINESCDSGYHHPRAGGKGVGDNINPAKGDSVILELDESESTPGDWKITSIPLKF